MIGTPARVGYIEPYNDPRYNRPMHLMREIRFSVGGDPAGPVLNSWAGWPAAVGLQPFAVLRATLVGEPDPATGYICNIRLIDKALREVAVPLAGRLYSENRLNGEQLIQRLAQALQPHAPTRTSWHSWQLFTTPYLSFQVLAQEPAMVHVTQSFEFSAAHRLHCEALSPEQNREIFGKCNNPSGHGHNYQVEVTVAGEIDSTTGTLIPLHALEQTVKARVIDRLDHKHLNVDCPEFAGLNPSVENITRVIWGLLDGQFGPARLERVRVWETPKTYAELGRSNP